MVDDPREPRELRALASSRRRLAVAASLALSAASLASLASTSRASSTSISSDKIEEERREDEYIQLILESLTPDKRIRRCLRVFSEKLTAFIDFVKERIARFKAPAAVEFGDLPKTATGKVQKFVLRDKEWSGSEKKVN